MRMLLGLLACLLSAVTVGAQELELAPEKMRPMGATAAARAISVEGEPALLLSCNFQGTRIDRASWDVSWNVDLSQSDGIELEIRCDDLAPIGNINCYLQSGEGWYAATLALEPGKWVRARLKPQSTRIEGRPAGWSAVRTLRLSAWRGQDRDTQLMLRKVRAVPAADASVVVLRAESPQGEGSAAEFTSQMCAMLESAQVSYRMGSDLDDPARMLRGAKILLMPHTPSMRPEAASAVAEWMKGGGRVLSFFHVPEVIATAGGIRMGRFIRQRESGDFATIEPTAALRDAPARAGQRSWNIIEATPVAADAQVLAHWLNAAGERAEAPAVVGSPRLVHMSHVLLNDDAAAKRQLLLAMLGQLDERIWAEAAGAMVKQAEDAASRQHASAAAQSAVVKARSAVQESRGLLEEKKWARAIESAGAAQRLVTEAFCLDQTPKAGEWRGLWGHRANGIDGESWDVSLARLKQNGFTAIVPNMLWGGVAFYPSEVLPQASEVKQGRDYIAECLTAARKHGIEVHVWKVNWNMGGHAPAAFVEQMKAAGRTQVMFDGKPQERWLCPSHPENQTLEIESMLEVARKYEVDGIHFDYIRYPGADGCFCGGCRERFETASGAKVANWPTSVRSDAELREKWLQFRRDQITRVVAEVSRRVRAEHPRVKVSAAVFPNWTSARNDVAQDWKLWCEKGYLDFVCPMDYTESNAQFTQYVANQKQWAAGVPLYPGIGLSTWTGAQRDVVKLIEQIKITRAQQTPGFIIFEYDRQAAESVVPMCGLGITRP